MPETPKKRLSATYEVQVRIDAEWQVAHALEDRDGAILEAIALIGEHQDQVPIRVLGELPDALTNTTRASSGATSRHRSRRRPCSTRKGARRA
jgi:hypothetical protein